MTEQQHTQEMVELLPCPFCGREARVGRVGRLKQGICYHCEAAGPLCETDAGAAHAWNTRSVAERDALRAAAMGMRQVLVRYRTETPLGHQPHMIAHVADLAIAEFDAALSPNQGAKL